MFGNFFNMRIQIVDNFFVRLFCHLKNIYIFAGQTLKQNAMKRLLLQALLILGVIAMTSCERTQTTTIEGQVRTFGTEDPIKHPPVVVELISTISGGGGMIGGIAVEVLDSVRTDEDGSFSVTADLTKNGEYFLAVKENSIKGHGYIRRSYYPTNPSREQGRIEGRGGTIKQNFYMVARAWVEYHILNTNPQPGDKISYSFGGGLKGVDYGDADRKIVVNYVGNRSYNYYYFVTRNGEYNSYQEQVFPIAFDTIQVDIHF